MSMLMDLRDDINYFEGEHPEEIMYLVACSLSKQPVGSSTYLKALEKYPEYFKKKGQISERTAYGYPKKGAHRPFKKDSRQVERNAICPCGYGKKYKKCCINK